MIAQDKLSEAIEFLKNEIAPNAAAIDQSTDAVRSALQKMASRDLMALKRPQQYGGPEISESEMRGFQEECARASGTFAFLQTQHQSAASLIASSSNETLKRDFLPYMGDGRKMVGIGFSQLRRPGPPITTAVPVNGGYLVNGHVPWVTGWSYYQEFLVGASLPDGSAVFAVVPLTAQKGVKISLPMELASMEAAQTVTVDFEDLYVDDDKVAYVRPPGWILSSDQSNIAFQGHFAIGCAMAGLDVLESASKRKSSPEITQVLQELTKELSLCRKATAEAQQLSGDETTSQRLEARTWAIDLAFRCAQAAIISSSGGANSLSHPAQRIYREALVFAVSAQTSSIMTASLLRLTKNIVQ